MEYISDTTLIISENKETHTEISNCIGDIEIEDDSHLLQTEKSSYLIFDLTVSLQTRLKAVEKCIEECTDEQSMLDVINRIGTMYFFSESKIIEEYLYSLVTLSKINVFLKLCCCSHLLSYSEQGYDCYDFMCKEYSGVLPTPNRIECMFILLRSTTHLEKAVYYIDSFLNDKTIECQLRYSTVITRINQIPKDHAKSMLISFSKNNNTPYTYRILAIQYLLSNYKDVHDLSYHLIQIIEDHNIAYNVRADACDVLLQYGNEQDKKIASMVLENLAKDGKMEIRTVYDNAQNVHIKSIEQSAFNILVTLYGDNKSPKQFEVVCKELFEYLDNLTDKTISKEKIKAAIGRIYIDRARYTSLNLELHKIFCKVWTYICSHEHSQELKYRLLEELEDSSEICSTGYVVRMINTLSGYTEFNITISYEDQIISNLSASLNKKILECKDEKRIEVLLEEMMIPSQCYSQRINFLKFFREVISEIREDMYQEFKDYITDTDYDLYFRKAVLKYQGDFIQ